MATEVQLSVVIATPHPWPNSRECLEILLPQITGIDAEILLADSSGTGLPEPVPEHLKSVRWIKAPGVSVFHLRALGTFAATGKIIAWTEAFLLAGSNERVSLLSGGDDRELLRDIPALAGGGGCAA